MGDLQSSAEFFFREYLTLLRKFSSSPAFPCFSKRVLSPPKNTTLFFHLFFEFFYSLLFFLFRRRWNEVMTSCVLLPSIIPTPFVSQCQIGVFPPQESLGKSGEFQINSWVSWALSLIEVTLAIRSSVLLFKPFPHGFVSQPSVFDPMSGLTYCPLPGFSSF